jgi:hypothetical protein
LSFPLLPDVRTDRRRDLRLEVKEEQNVENM